MRLLPLLALTLAACTPSAPPPQNDAAPASALTTVPLRIATASGPQILNMEVAVTEAEQEQGLMHRSTLPPGHGMLFPFAFPRMASFWMKDTPLPLDLLYVRPDGTVATILHGKPEDLTPLSANDPVSAVIEIGDGEAARLHIAPGDRVQWGDCAQGRIRPGEPLNPLAFCP